MHQQSDPTNPYGQSDLARRPDAPRGQPSHHLIHLLRCRVALIVRWEIQRNQRLSFALKYEILPLILIFLPLNLRQGSQTFAANIDE